jgi:hypothetical protein
LRQRAGGRIVLAAARPVRVGALRSGRSLAAAGEASVNDRRAALQAIRCELRGVQARLTAQDADAAARPAGSEAPGNAGERVVNVAVVPDRSPRKTKPRPRRS